MYPTKELLWRMHNKYLQTYQEKDKQTYLNIDKRHEQAFHRREHINGQ